MAEKERQEMLNLGERRIITVMPLSMVARIKDVAREESARLHLKVSMSDVIRKAVMRYTKLDK